MIIGLTGGIGSGKSCVARRWRERGASLVIADEIARAVVVPGTPALAALARELGPDILDADGSLLRGELARRMFADPDVRRRVESILHPAITARVREDFARLAHPIVYEAPLLFEAGHDALVDVVVVVTAPRRLRLQRAALRDGADPAQVRARMAAQWTDAQRIARAQAVIVNDGTLAQLWAAADACWDDLVSGAPLRERYG